VELLLGRGHGLKGSPSRGELHEKTRMRKSPSRDELERDLGLRRSSFEAISMSRAEILLERIGLRNRRSSSRVELQLERMHGLGG
jgi:hypothetical protein